MIKTININHLYHTTELITDKSENPYDLPINTFSTDLTHGKFFTMHHLASYGDDWTGNKYYFLKYKCKRPLKLLDVRDDRFKINCIDIIEKYVIFHNLDGYIGAEDFYEIYLINPINCVHENFKQLSNFYLINNDNIAKVNQYCDEIINATANNEPIVIDDVSINSIILTVPSECIRLKN